METLSIESKRPFSLELIKRTISQYWRVEASAADTLIVHGSGTRAYLHTDTMPEAGEVHRLLLDYSDLELAKGLVEKIADNPNFTVNNDFGTVLPGNEFVTRIKTEKGWNWRG